MKKIFNWNHKVGGNCPIQADGIFFFGLLFLFQV
jgi:hypothetical protein